LTDRISTNFHSALSACACRAARGFASFAAELAGKLLFLTGISFLTHRSNVKQLDIFGFTAKDGLHGMACYSSLRSLIQKDDW
jgi:hypothetical protein